MFTKKTLARADSGYVVARVPILGQSRLAVASEDHGPAQLFVELDAEPTAISRQPGGCMGIAPIPRDDTALLMISGFYPIFQGQSAGVELLQSAGTLDAPWEQTRVVDVPYLHRIATISSPVGDFVFAGSVCGGKDYQDDWSYPGAVYAVRIPAAYNDLWHKSIVVNELHKNHGMTVWEENGARSVVVSGTEGAIAISLGPESDAESVHELQWQTDVLIPEEISEIQFLDLDGDGKQEIVTIGPFHGDEFSVFKEINGQWRRVYSDRIVFGHGLSAGVLSGIPTVVVGQRSGDGDLLCYQPEEIGSSKMKRSVIDHGTGTLGTVFLAQDGVEGIAAANSEPAEYSFYRTQ